MRKSLALKEQDLTYAKKRNEKLINEIETLKKQDESTELKKALRDEVQQSEELRKQIEALRNSQTADMNS